MVTTVDTGAEAEAVEVDTTVVEAPVVDGAVVVVIPFFTLPLAVVVEEVLVVDVVDVVDVVAGIEVGMASCSGTLHIRVNSLYEM